MVLCEERVGGQPPIPTVTFHIIPTTLHISHLVFVSFDDTCFLDCGPEGLVPSLSQCSNMVVVRVLRTVECTFGLDRPVEVVFGNVPAVVMFTVLYKLNQLPESRVGVLDGLSKVRSVVVERLVCISLNNHTII